MAHRPPTPHIPANVVPEDNLSPNATAQSPLLAVAHSATGAVSLATIEEVERFGDP
jgi:hypothetical protein